MKSKVYFYPSKIGKRKISLVDKLEYGLKKLSLDFIEKDSLVGIKLSFGEDGNTAYLRHIYVKKVVDMVKERGGKPFLTETSTLYHGMRMNGVDHSSLAISHGFGYAQVGAPIIMADGLASESNVDVEINLKHFKELKVGGALQSTDYLISLAHFKGHLVAGFGGTIKNIGMGLVGRSSKQRMHASVVKPQFKNVDCCTGCGVCKSVCRFDAIEIVDGKAHFDYEKCQGCADCIPACPTNCLKILWTEKPENLGEKMVEGVYAVLKMVKKAIFVNFLIDITPDCDCFSYSDNPIVPDIGILLSDDPIAIDKASCDLLQSVEGIPQTKIGRVGKKSDKLKALHPEIDWQVHLKYGEEIGLGSLDYELISLE